MRFRSFVGTFISPEVKQKYYHLRHSLTGKKEYWHFEPEEKEAFLRKAIRGLAFNGIPGDYLEFGCHSGVTFTAAHRQIKAMGTSRHLWAFDSFEGLPAAQGVEHPQWVEGILRTSEDDFKAICAKNGVEPSEMTCVVGMYSDTIGPNATYSKELPDDVALAYVDCDMLSSTREVLFFLEKIIKHGSILAFDDYFVYDTDNLSGNRAAFLELCSRITRFNFLPYLPFSWNGMSFIVEDSQTVARHKETRTHDRGL